MKGQSRRWSLIEAWINVIVGFGINYIANLLILPIFFGISISLLDNFYIGLIFTVVSVVRSYGLRRFFNWVHVKQND